MVEVAVSDYFEAPDTQEAQHLFGEILGTLKVSLNHLQASHWLTGVP